MVCDMRREAIDCSCDGRLGNEEGEGNWIANYTKTDVVRAVTICAGAIGLHRPRHEALELAPDDVVESEADDVDEDGGWLKLGRGKEIRVGNRE